jgi:hypothetical protein
MSISSSSSDEKVLISWLNRMMESLDTDQDFQHIQILDEIEQVITPSQSRNAALIS